MILRKEITIDFPIPRTLAEADRVWQENGDDIEYSFAVEDVEGLAEEYMLCNVLSESQCCRILERYGCR